MSPDSTRTADGGATDSESLPQRAAAALRRRGRDGSLATLGGTALLGLALRAVRSRRKRATLLGLAGLAALGAGVRQRRAADGADRVVTGADARRDEDGEKAVSDHAYAQIHQSLGAGRTAREGASVEQSPTDPNPRGVGGGVDAETDQGGDVEFVEGETPEDHRETHLEDEDAHDPRLHPDSDAEQTEIDLSKSAMADETSEAAGPHPEQAYPASEGTDPEPTARKSPEWVEGSEEAADAEATDGSEEEPEQGADDESETDEENQPRAQGDEEERSEE